MTGNNIYNFVMVLCVLLNDRMHCMMSLESDKTRLAFFLCGPGKAGRGYI